MRAKMKGWIFSVTYIFDINNTKPFLSKLGGGAYMGGVGHIIESVSKTHSDYVSTYSFVCM